MDPPKFNIKTYVYISTEGKIDAQQWREKLLLNWNILMEHNCRLLILGHVHGANQVSITQKSHDSLREDMITLNSTRYVKDICKMISILQADLDYDHCSDTLVTTVPEGRDKGDNISRFKEGMKLSKHGDSTETLAGVVTFVVRTVRANDAYSSSSDESDQDDFNDPCFSGRMRKALKGDRNYFKKAGILQVFGFREIESESDVEDMFEVLEDGSRKDQILERFFDMIIDRDPRLHRSLYLMFFPIRDPEKRKEFMEHSKKLFKVAENDGDFDEAARVLLDHDNDNFMAE